jgi:hypothetical protein
MDVRLDQLGAFLDVIAARPDQMAVH